ncbi:MAG: hypothetical protein M0R68_01840 [Bacteroidetes bacterium]|nr:hypothetical protein [Bacteroidota bacterium]
MILTSIEESVKRSFPLWFAPILFLLSIFYTQTLNAQFSAPDSVWLNDDWYFPDIASSFVDPAEFLPPLLRAETKIKRYLRDERFYDLRKRYDDTLAVDAIFDRALMLCEGNIRMALLISTIAVMDHRRLGLKIPLIGSFFLPLTSENDSLFRLRRTHLPKKLLSDNVRASDKDKLQHFFGSAYLAYTTNSNVIAEYIGDLFELGEDRFVLGGRSDDRDQLANAKGRLFGLGLLKDAGLLPSDILWSPSKEAD